jgi:ADP-ribose pyrophosphatase
MDGDDWTLLESVTEYETGWYTGGYDRYEQPDGTEKKYYWAQLPPAVVVVARDGGELVFVEQFRPAIGRRCLELVAGIVEEDGPSAHGGEGASGGRGEGNDTRPEPGRERYIDAAARELEEETGYAADSYTFLADFWCSTGVLRHRRGIVYAEALSGTEAGRALDTNEFIEVTRYPIEGAFERAAAAPANDATLEGLLLAEREGLLQGDG